MTKSVTNRRPPAGDPFGSAGAPPQGAVGKKWQSRRQPPSGTEDERRIPGSIPPVAMASIITKGAMSMVSGVR
jgi:hypothetical protein